MSGLLIGNFGGTLGQPRVTSGYFRDKLGSTQGQLCGNQGTTSGHFRGKLGATYGQLSGSSGAAGGNLGAT